MDLTPPNRAAMLALSAEKKWQIYCNRKKVSREKTNTDNIATLALLPPTFLLRGSARLSVTFQRATLVFQTPFSSADVTFHAVIKINNTTGREDVENRNTFTEARLLDCFVTVGFQSRRNEFFLLAVLWFTLLFVLFLSVEEKSHELRDLTSRCGWAWGGDVCWMMTPHASKRTP